MRKALVIVVLVSFFVGVGCCPCRMAGASTSVVDTTNNYATHHDIVRIVIRDTMHLLPLSQSHDQLVTKHTYSELDNEYCISVAEIDAEGLLHHSLDTKDRAMLPVRTIYRDSVVRDTIIRYAERVERRTQQVKVKVAPWWVKPLGAITATLAVIVLWQNRKRIMTIIRLWRI